MSNLEKALIKVFNAEHHQGHDESQASKHNGGNPRIDKLNPTWEVDQFHWPSDCDQLLEACGDSFGEAAMRLNQRGKVVVVTSCHRKEGRTTFALALAKWLSRQQMRVTLVDADSKNLQLSLRLEVDDLCEFACRRVPRRGPSGGFCASKLSPGEFCAPLGAPAQNGAQGQI
ncbi:MAG: hypothetical protein IH991_13045 [Planctomycetes bacterium]|nr:hypothetical protein [Planctomycetota bacterium]